LIRRCQEGDDMARAQFCAAYMELVRWAVRRKLATALEGPLLETDAEDISNEVFERLLADNCMALTRLHRPQSLRAWLITVAQNRTVDWIRKHRARLRTQDAVTSEDDGACVPSPLEHAVERERLAIVQAGLDELPALDRLILNLYYVRGLKYAEIAQATSMNINTMSTRLHRAKNRLRDLLEDRRDALSNR